MVQHATSGMGRVSAAGALMLTSLTWSAVVAEQPRESAARRVAPAPTTVAGKLPAAATPPLARAAATMERVRDAVLGDSPTMTAPATSPGLSTLGSGQASRAGAASGHKTAWTDYMIAPNVPGWSLRLKTENGFAVEGAGNQQSAQGVTVASQRPLPTDPTAKFGFGTASTSTSTPAAPGARPWLTHNGWGAAQTSPMTAPLVPVGGIAAGGADSLLLPTQIATPSPGAMIGAASVPASRGQ